MDKRKSIVRQGYDQAAKLYAQHRHQLRSDKYLYKLIDLLPKQAEILDIGCGDGVPVDQILVKKDFLVTGIDISSVQIGLAQKNVPRGNFLVRDMTQLRSGEFEVAAVVCFYALFHIDRDRHLEILKKINSFLPQNGYLLITMGDRDFEGYHDLFGAKMWSSHFGPNKNRQLLKQAGFKILLDEIDDSGREKHQILLCQK